MNNEDWIFSSEDISDEIKDLVIARIDARISPNLKLSIGDVGSLDKDQMIKHVREGDEIGRQIMQVHLSFIKAQASGKLISALNSVK
jgi:hypothetical protein